MLHGAGTKVGSHCSGDKKHEQRVSQLVHVGQLAPHVESWLMAAGKEPLSDHTMVTSHARRSSCKRYGNAAMTTASNPNVGSSIAKLRRPSGSFQAPTDATLNPTNVPGDGACGCAVACSVARMQCELVVLLHAELPGVPVSMVNWPPSVKVIASRVIVAAFKHHDVSGLCGLW